jgi:hypothetical protein
LSFLGRHTNRSSTPEPEKKTLVISGPIINTPAGGETGDENHSFGTVRVFFAVTGRRIEVSSHGRV